MTSEECWRIDIGGENGKETKDRLWGAGRLPFLMDLIQEWKVVYLQKDNFEVIEVAL